MIKNKKANVLHTCLVDCKKSKNGGFNYENFHPAKKMVECKGLYMKGENHQDVFVLKPNVDGCVTCPKFVSDLFMGEQESQLVNPTWKKLQLNQKYDPISCMVLPEFLNPFAFVSSYAWLINKLHSRHNLDRCHGIQLLYVALLTPSQAQFHSVMNFIMKGYNDEMNLCCQYIKHCAENDLCAIGGHRAKFTVGGRAGVRAPKLSEIESNLEKIEVAIRALNEGRMLDAQSGMFVCDNYVVNIQGIGAARATSFPSLCCFTGFGTSQLAIQTAKQAVLNTGTSNDQTGRDSKLGALLRVNCDSPPYKNSYYHSILEQTGMSVGDVHSTMVNASFALTQPNMRHNVFIKEQTLYTLFLDADAFNRRSGKADKGNQDLSILTKTKVFEKEFGSTKWCVSNLDHWD